MNADSNLNSMENNKTKIETTLEYNQTTNIMEIESFDKKQVEIHYGINLKLKT